MSFVKLEFRFFNGAVDYENKNGRVRVIDNNGQGYKLKTNKTTQFRLVCFTGSVHNYGWINRFGP